MRFEPSTTNLIILTIGTNLTNIGWVNIQEPWLFFFAAVNKQLNHKENKTNLWDCKSEVERKRALKLKLNSRDTFSFLMTAANTVCFKPQTINQIGCQQLTEKNQSQKLYSTMTA